MKKIIILLLCIMCLYGCSKDDDSFKNEIKSNLEQASQIDIISYQNNNAEKKYYTYNIFANTVKKEGTDITNTFYIFNNKAVLNLDVAGIIANKYYLKNGENELILRAIDTLKDPIFTYTSTYMNSSQEKRTYRVFINKLNDNYNYIFIQTNEFLLNCFALKTDVPNVCYEMIKLLRSCKVDADKVIDDYSMVRQQEYSISGIVLFENIMPETGYVEDYLETWKENPAFNLID